LFIQSIKHIVNCSTCCCWFSCSSY